MAIIYLTGLSAVGKSSALTEMEKRGYHTVDLDYGYITLINDKPFIDEEKLQNLINAYGHKPLILAGTQSNQGKFYKQFQAVILLTADLDTILKRIERRTNNPYGKTTKERNQIIDQYASVLPLLHKRATHIIDTSHQTIPSVCDVIESLIS